MKPCLTLYMVVSTLHFLHSTRDRRPLKLADLQKWTRICPLGMCPFFLLRWSPSENAVTSQCNFLSVLPGGDLFCLVSCLSFQFCHLLFPFACNHTHIRTSCWNDSGIKNKCQVIAPDYTVPPTSGLNLCCPAALTIHQHTSSHDVWFQQRVDKQTKTLLLSQNRTGIWKDAPVFCVCALYNLQFVPKKSQIQSLWPMRVHKVF